MFVNFLTKFIMEKSSCSAQCAKSMAYFLLGVVVGGLIFYITTLVATEWVESNILRYKAPKLTTPVTTTVAPTTKINILAEPGTDID